MNLRKLISRVIRLILLNSLIYKIYEKMLWYQIKDGKRPEHIGLILDGNRRWAFEHDIPPWTGHRFGAEKIEELLDWCVDLDIKSITLYVFSTENFKRPSREVCEIMEIAEEKLRKLLLDGKIHQKRVRVKAMGRTHLLPKRIQELLSDVEEATKDYDQYYLNIAIAYGGRAEIVDATKKIAGEVQKGKLDVDQIDENLFERYLYTSYLPKSDPDLIIRTSGEERLSGFLLWQGAYSELCFLDVYWPDFRRIDLWRAVRTFQQRERRFGY